MAWRPPTAGRGAGGSPPEALRDGGAGGPSRNATCTTEPEGSFEELRRSLDHRLQHARTVTRGDLVERNIVQGVNVVRRAARELGPLLRRRPALAEMISAKRIPPDYLERLFPVPTGPHNWVAPLAERIERVSLHRLLAPPEEAAPPPQAAAATTAAAGPASLGQLDPAMLAAWQMVMQMARAPQPTAPAAGHLLRTGAPAPGLGPACQGQGMGHGAPGGDFGRTMPGVPGPLAAAAPAPWAGISPSAVSIAVSVPWVADPAESPLLQQHLISMSAARPTTLPLPPGPALTPAASGSVYGSQEPATGYGSQEPVSSARPERALDPTAETLQRIFATLQDSALSGGPQEVPAQGPPAAFPALRPPKPSLQAQRSVGGHYARTGEEKAPPFVLLVEAFCDRVLGTETA